jgi:16S rRNA U516 pseudouridylate synthase RsuA-like enzyme
MRTEEEIRKMMEHLLLCQDTSGLIREQARVLAWVLGDMEPGKARQMEIDKVREVLKEAGWFG